MDAMAMLLELTDLVFDEKNKIHNRKEVQKKLDQLEIELARLDDIMYSAGIT